MGNQIKPTSTMKRKRLRILGGLLCLSRCTAELAQIGESHSIRISSNENESDVHPIVEDDGSRKMKKKTFALRHFDETASYLSVHFSHFDFGPDCRMEITNGQGTQKTILTARGKQNLNSFWARHVDHSTMILTVECTGDLDKADFLIDKYVSGYATATNATIGTGENDPKTNYRNLGVCGDEDKKNVACYETSHPDEFKNSRPVAKLIIKGEYGCTGWMIAPYVLMTNGHCITNDNDALNTKYLFDYESTSCSSDDMKGSKTFDAVKVLKYDKEADYSLIQMESDPSATYGLLELEKRLPTVGEEVYIPHHPNGKDKELTIFESDPAFKGPTGRCTILTDGRGSVDNTCPYGATFKDFSYSCDTETGSSGAPVISATSGKVVGLHHCDGICGANFAIPIIEVFDEINNFLSGLSFSESPTLDPVSVPTLAPIGLIPAENECLLAINKSQCKSIMPSDMSPIQNCDCYNFCNGKFLTCCAAGQACALTCVGDLVAGCPLEMSTPPTPPPSSGQPSRPTMKPIQTPTIQPSKGNVQPPFFFWKGGLMAHSPKEENSNQTRFLKNRRRRRGE